MALSDIDHVVVLMLENRSFDSMLGYLYPPSVEFDGLTGDEVNNDLAGGRVPIWKGTGHDELAMSIPSPDPGELFVDINTQLFGTPDVADPASVARMKGFVASYLGQKAKPVADYVAKAIMHAYAPEQVPVLTKLAQSFAVCDRWHASAPCQTWPNRFFVHTGTANGYENNDPVHFPYEMDTIFNRFDKAGLPWKIYFHDMPQTMTLSQLWPRADRFRFYAEFQHDAQQGSLPAYSFIEPRYFPDLALPNDQHPPHVVTLGEQLIADVYNGLRSGPSWSKTLLIITYDEHGGCFDHVAPPPAKPPGSAVTAPFNFDRYGVRVPAVLVSPYIPTGLKFRPPAGTVCDHTSIIATLRKRWPLGDKLTERDNVAPTLETALTLASPTNNGPNRVDALPYVPTPADVATAQAEPLNDHQRGLLQLAAHLPATTATGDFQAFIDTYIAHLRAGAEGTATEGIQDTATALAFIKGRLGNLFRSLG